MNKLEDRINNTFEVISCKDKELKLKINDTYLFNSKASYLTISRGKEKILKVYDKKNKVIDTLNFDYNTILRYIFMYCLNREILLNLSDDIKTIILNEDTMVGKFSLTITDISGNSDFIPFGRGWSEKEAKEYVKKRFPQVNTFIERPIKNTRVITWDTNIK